MNTFFPPFSYLVIHPPPFRFYTHSPLALGCVCTCGNGKKISLGLELFSHYLQTGAYLTEKVLVSTFVHTSGVGWLALNKHSRN